MLVVVVFIREYMLMRVRHDVSALLASYRYCGIINLIYNERLVEDDPSCPQEGFTSIFIL